MDKLSAIERLTKPFQLSYSSSKLHVTEFPPCETTGGSSFIEGKLMSRFHLGSLVKATLTFSRKLVTLLLFSRTIILLLQVFSVFREGKMKE